jgi:uncharacterized repeat protein (TIGR01451 family)
VAQSIDNATPYFGAPVVLKTTVDNLSSVDNLSTHTASGVTVSIPVPSGLTYLSSSSGYDPATSTWTIGKLAAHGHAVLTITAQAGNVYLGDQTVTATAHSTTTQTGSSIDTASVTEHSVPATVAVAIIPDPANPLPVDIARPGTISWTASVTNAVNPSARAPLFTISWVCDTVSASPCPASDALVFPNESTLSFQVSDLGVDTYTITLLALDEGDPNYQSGNFQTSIAFSTTDSGGI